MGQWICLYLPEKPGLEACCSIFSAAGDRRQGKISPMGSSSAMQRMAQKLAIMNDLLKSGLLQKLTTTSAETHSSIGPRECLDFYDSTAIKMKIIMMMYCQAPSGSSVRVISAPFSLSLFPPRSLFLSFRLQEEYEIGNELLPCLDEFFTLSLLLSLGTHFYIFNSSVKCLSA